ncbi:hypothetical protein IWX90DRAFT_238641 [Phyllosticta citrichinensis]|uniref:Uncharacterized protein n=1 Tax=Phyllosticta citrichinensis TaxID=1130410 RepID=A0ABR1XPY9_9PEZI
MPSWPHSLSFAARASFVARWRTKERPHAHHRPRGIFTPPSVICLLLTVDPRPIPDTVPSISWAAQPVFACATPRSLVNIGAGVSISMPCLAVDENSSSVLRYVPYLFRDLIWDLRRVGVGRDSHRRATKKKKKSGKASCQPARVPSLRQAGESHRWLRDGRLTSMHPWAWRRRTADYRINAG